MTVPRPTGDRLGLIYGFSLPEGAEPIEGDRVVVDAGGPRPVEAIDGGAAVAIARHRFDRTVPAHLVDHRANVRAVCELGCNRVLALGSAGSLDERLEVGALICPDDFYAPEIALSFYDDPRGHSIFPASIPTDPELSAGDLDADLVYAASGSVVDTTVVAGRVLMRDQVVPAADELVAEVRSRATRLTA